MKKILEQSLSMIPQGVATHLPEATLLRREIEKKGMAVLKKFGFQEVITPLFEYLDVLSLGMGPEMIERGYKFIDRSNGRFMILRPDVTPQIARMVSMHFRGAAKPVRLCYFTNVFRHEEAHAGREREIFQIGGETFGGVKPSDDAELIEVVTGILKALKLSRYRIVMGHAGFFKSILSRCPVDSQKEIQSAIARKEISRLERIIEEKKITGRSAEELLGIFSLFGGEEVFRKARKLCREKETLAALDHLKAIFSVLKKKGLEGNLLIDLGEVRDFDYYTGPVFEILVEGIGYEIGGGGRYDHLSAKYGYDCPARGFALDVEKLQQAIEKNS